MDSFHSPYPQSMFQVVQKDEFLDMLNESSQHQFLPENGRHFDQYFGEDCDFQSILDQNDLKAKNNEKQWMFGTNPFEMKFEESPPENNPFFEHNPQIIPISVKRECRSDSYFGNQLLELAPQSQPSRLFTAKATNNKEQEIILNNKELFKANQSKSIYLSKISTLIDRNVSPPGSNASSGGLPLSPSTNLKIKEKIMRKTSNGKQDSESSSDVKSGEPLQSKLAKNRESARNSRKRKKVYVELLENKVFELTEQLSKMETLCTHQRIYIDQCQNVNQKVHQLFSQESQFMENLNNALKYKQPVEPILRLMEFSVGASSEARTGVCEYYFNGLIQSIQTSQARYFCEGAEKSTGVFSQMGNELLRSLQTQIQSEYSQLKDQIQYVYKQVTDIRNTSCKLETLERQLMAIMTPTVYTEQILQMNNLKVQQLESEAAIKIEEISENQSQRKKQIKTT